VVGLFAADGSAFESEVWVDIDDLFTDTNYGGYSSVTLTIAPGADRDALSRRIAEDPRISLQARSEVDYYREQAGDGDTLYLLTVALAGIMGTGAVFAALNTMSAAVVARTAEIGTLRALGFRRGAVLHSFISESVCISLMGYIWGVALGVGAVTLINLVMRGVAFQRRGFTTVVVTLHLSLSILLATLLLAVLIGIFAGLLPAYQAARLRVTEALRRAG
jgi:putative ABC transport system permease protein